MKVIKNIKPIDLIHISNNYNIINKNNDDYIINIYYLSIQKIQILVRKINAITGWNYNMKIQVFGKNKNEIFDIGTSQKNYKKINIYSKNIIFDKKPSKILKIPKKIIQTHKDDIFNNELSYNSIQTFIDFNPNYEYTFFNDVECREFIKDNFNNEYLYYYDIIYPGAFKADYFRYCYLYINGGFYFDCKSILLTSLDDLLTENDELVLCQDYHKLGLYNAVIMSIPNNKIFINLINKIIYKINNFNNIYNPIKDYKNYIKLDNILSLTGPNLLYEEFNLLELDYNKHILMKHDIIGNYKNYKNLIIKFRKEIFMYKNYNNFIINSKHYSVLWKNHHILYKNHYYNNNNHFYISPFTSNTNESVNNIEFYLVNDKVLMISKKNINYNFEVSIIDNKSNYTNIDIIGKNKIYYIFDYESYNDFNYSIRSIKIDDKYNDIINKTYEFSINKIYNNYFLIIMNKNMNNNTNNNTNNNSNNNTNNNSNNNTIKDDINLEITTNLIKFDFILSNSLNENYLIENYLIENITNLFIN